MSANTDKVVNLDAVERERILSLNARREREVRNGRYAPWQPGAELMRVSSRGLSAKMLHKAGVFPEPGHPCLEIGYGTIGWMGDLISWGLRARDLHGIELDPQRAAVMRAAL